MEGEEERDRRGEREKVIVVDSLCGRGQIEDTVDAGCSDSRVLADPRMESEVSSRSDGHDVFSFSVLDALTGQRVNLSLPCGCRSAQPCLSSAAPDAPSVFASFGEHSLPPWSILKWLRSSS